MRLKDLEEALRSQAEADEAAAKAVRRWHPGEMLRSLKDIRIRLGRKRRDDFVIAGLGISLGLGCALFPWYIFLNQEKFGVRAMEFEGNGSYDAPIALGSSGERIGAPVSPNIIPPEKLDLFATGTVSEHSDAQPATAPADAQPFPGASVEYRMVYAAAGRAMIADDSGLWVVQRGSVLPDNSKVAGIEQRNGKWVLVTTAGKVLELSKD